MTFSERIGLAQKREYLQVQDLDAVTRNRMWNLISPVFSSRYDYPGNLDLCYGQRAYVDEVLKHKVDAYSVRDLYTYARNLFNEGEWHILLSTVEFFVKTSSELPPGVDVAISRHESSWNLLFEEEGVAYRFVASELVPISSEIEIQSIESALASKGGAQSHLRTALQLLRPGQGNRVDTEQVVTEAVHACESAVRFRSGNPKAEMGFGLKAIEQQFGEHSALIKGFRSIYGWASDRPGLRHASHGNETPFSVEDAVMILCLASAFVNRVMAMPEI